MKPDNDLLRNKDLVGSENTMSSYDEGATNYGLVGVNDEAYRLDILVCHVHSFHSVDPVIRSSEYMPRMPLTLTTNRTNNPPSTTEDAPYKEYIIERSEETDGSWRPP